MHFTKDGFDKYHIGMPQNHFRNLKPLIDYPDAKRFRVGPGAYTYFFDALLPSNSMGTNVLIAAFDHNKNIAGIFLFGKGDSSGAAGEMEMVWGKPVLASESSIQGLFTNGKQMWAEPSGILVFLTQYHNQKFLISIYQSSPFNSMPFVSMIDGE